MQLWQGIQLFEAAPLLPRLNAVLESIAVLTVAVAALELGQTILEEEVHRQAQMSAPTRVRRFLSRFMVVLVVALSIETVVLVFRLSQDAPEQLPYAASVGVAAALLLVAWGAVHPPQPQRRGARARGDAGRQARRPQDRKISQRRSEAMSITRHDQTAILSQAVQYGDTVYLAGVVAKNLDQDVKGQTKQILDDIDRLLAKCGSNKSKVLQAHDLGHRHPQPRADERGVDRLGRREEPAGARLHRGQARRPQGAGRNHGDRREVALQNALFVADRAGA